MIEEGLTVPARPGRVAAEPYVWRGFPRRALDHAVAQDPHRANDRRVVEQLLAIRQQHRATEVLSIPITRGPLARAHDRGGRPWADAARLGPCQSLRGVRPRHGTAGRPRAEGGCVASTFDKRWQTHQMAKTHSFAVTGPSGCRSSSWCHGATGAGTSKSSLWRAIKSGRISATKTDGGDYCIDPAELFRAFPPRSESETLERPSGRATGQTVTGVETSGDADETAVQVRLAALDAEIAGLKALLVERDKVLAEVRASRDELRQDRDEWRGRAERLLSPPERRPWWRRLAG